MGPPKKTKKRSPGKGHSGCLKMGEPPTNLRHFSFGSNPKVGGRAKPPHRPSCAAAIHLGARLPEGLAPESSPDLRGNRKVRRTSRWALGERRRHAGQTETCHGGIGRTKTPCLPTGQKPALRAHGNLMSDLGSGTYATFERDKSAPGTASPTVGLGSSASGYLWLHTSCFLPFGPRGRPLPKMAVSHTPEIAWRFIVTGPTQADKVLKWVWPQ